MTQVLTQSQLSPLHPAGRPSSADGEMIYETQGYTQYSFFVSMLFQCLVPRKVNLLIV